MRECTMTKFEYKCVFIWGGAEKTTKKLNQLGQEDWEFISANWVWFYFRRSLD